MKKKTIKTRQPRKANRVRRSPARNTQPRRSESPGIKDSGAVKVARSSVESIVEDAQKTIEAGATEQASQPDGLKEGGQVTSL